MRVWAKKKSQSKEDLYFAVKFARQKLSKYHTEVTPMTGVLRISADILDPLRKLRLFRKWHIGMDIDPDDVTSYTTQYQQAFLKYMEHEYFGKRTCLPVIKPRGLPSNNLFPPAMSSASSQSFFDSDDLYSNDEEYVMPEN